MSTSDSKLPVLASMMLVFLGLLIGVISGIATGSIVGGVVAGLGIIPACYGMWVGIQDKESQAGLLWSILAFLAAISVSGLLLILRFLDWLR